MSQGFTNRNKTALPSSGSSTLYDLTDVVISSPSNNQVLKYNGSTWVNGTDATGAGSGITRSINSIIINTTAGETPSTDYVYFCSTNLTLTLPNCLGNTNRYTVKCLSGTLTINTTLLQTIDGSSSIIVAVEDSVDIISDSIEWKIV